MQVFIKTFEFWNWKKTSSNQLGFFSLFFVHDVVSQFTKTQIFRLQTTHSQFWFWLAIAKKKIYKSKRKENISSTKLKLSVSCKYAMYSWQNHNFSKSRILCWHWKNLVTTNVLKCFPHAFSLQTRLFFRLVLTKPQNL